jgi:CRP-like cAMP-binding protein
MALLDPEPRSASITAETDTLLLRLDQAPFYELMDEHNQIARGIIRMLTRHLRARVRDLADVRLRIDSGAEPVSAPLAQP